MQTTSPQDEMFEQLLAIDEQTFAVGQYQTAYHALATALHRAIDLGSAPLLDRVRIRARDHLRQVQGASRLRTVSGLYNGLVQLAANHAQIPASDYRCANLTLPLLIPPGLAGGR